MGIENPGPLPCGKEHDHDDEVERRTRTKGTRAREGEPAGPNWSCTLSLIPHALDGPHPRGRLEFGARTKTEPIPAEPRVPPPRPHPLLLRYRRLQPRR